MGCFYCIYLCGERFKVADWLRICLIIPVDNFPENFPNFSDRSSNQDNKTSCVKSFSFLLEDTLNFLIRDSIEQV